MLAARGCALTRPTEQLNRFRSVVLANRKSGRTRDHPPNSDPFFTSRLGRGEARINFPLEVAPAGSYIVKCYDKGKELLKHGGADAFEVAKWALTVGLVRHEISLKSMWLRQAGVQRPEQWTLELMAQVVEQYAMHAKVGVSSSGWSRVYEQLIDLGVTPGRAHRAQEAGYAYLSGHTFRRGENISRPAFYRLRSDLHKVGVDVGAPLNVSALHFSVREVELKPDYLPSGFRRVG